jgi:hypothetical protein
MGPYATNKSQIAPGSSNPYTLGPFVLKLADVPLDNEAIRTGINSNRASRHYHSRNNSSMTLPDIEIDPQVYTVPTTLVPSAAPSLQVPSSGDKSAAHSWKSTGGTIDSTEYKERQQEIDDASARRASKRSRRKRAMVKQWLNAELSVEEQSLLDDPTDEEYSYVASRVHSLKGEAEEFCSGDDERRSEGDESGPTHFEEDAEEEVGVPF